MSHSSADRKEEEQQFSIQPHPATTNDPSSDPALTKETGHAADPTGKPGPYIPSSHEGDHEGTAGGVGKLGEPLSREELHKRHEELNKH